MTRREQILKLCREKIFYKCDHSFHRLGGMSDCPDCSIILALIEENEKLRGALEAYRSVDATPGGNCVNFIADKALASSPLDELLEGEK